MDPLDEPWQPVYTTEQVAQYLDYVGIGPAYRVDAKPTLDNIFLTQLHIHHISTFPYENLRLHYDPHHTVSLDPQDLFKKMVADNRGRGGYCFESVLFFLHILQALGFDTYPTGVRIRLREGGVPTGPFTACSHLVIITTVQTALGPLKYISDPAFGGDGPTRPLPLLEDHPTLNFGTQQVRYIYAPLPQLVRIPRRLTPTPQYWWQYQYRNSPEKSWNSFYAFQENQFLVEDFGVLNIYTCSWATFQRRNLLAIKFFRKDGADENGQSGNGNSVICGKLMLVGDTLKRNLGGKTEIVMVCKSEEERVRVLREELGISLTPEEVKGIRGLPTEIQELKFEYVDADVVKDEELADEDLQNTG